jgi:hypothetical protein
MHLKHSSPQYQFTVQIKSPPFSYLFSPKKRVVFYHSCILLVINFDVFAKTPLRLPTTNLYTHKEIEISSSPKQCRAFSIFLLCMGRGFEHPVA